MRESSGNPARPEVKKLIDFLNNEMMKGTSKQRARGFRRGHQADFADGHQAAGPACDPARHREQSQGRDPGAQGQHHEVHRRGVPRLGIRAGHQEFRSQVVTERESWILDNKDKEGNLSVEKNAEMIEPGSNRRPRIFEGRFTPK